MNHIEPHTDHVVIVSGGMDSFTLLHEIVTRVGLSDGNDRVFVLSFDYGQRHVRELECVKNFCDALPDVRLRTLPMHFLRDLAGPTALTGGVAVPHGHYAAESMKLTVVPGRNTLMLAAALSFAESVIAQGERDLGGQREAIVYFGAHAGDHHIYPDCRPEFISAMLRVMLTASAGKVQLAAPFKYKSKSEILTHGLVTLNIPVTAYAETWTCYEGGEHPCGKCGSCVERAEAFADNGVADPLIERAIAAGVRYLPATDNSIRVGDTNSILDQS